VKPVAAAKARWIMTIFAVYNAIFGCVCATILEIFTEVVFAASVLLFRRHLACFCFVTCFASANGSGSMILFTSSLVV